ncbi:GntR family transcriptional regulator [Williamsia soli]|uniref:GntR family transcriptional regulator n=1 Tax=Williamsia soli TaxID=364929 RepID=UPI001A9F7B11|nr:GntR family transcriptional regulator [Williamsia soli]
MRKEDGIGLQLDPDSDVAPYEQVRRGVIELVNSGRLLAGSRIPTVRALAQELSLAPNTVARSYRELEAEDVIETRGRQGSFIKAHADSALQRAALLTVEHVAALRQLRVDDGHIKSLLDQALRR